MANKDFSPYNCAVSSPYLHCNYRMFIVCSPYVHRMFTTVCSPYVHRMFTVFSPPYVHRMFTTVFSPPYVHRMFTTVCSPYVHPICRISRRIGQRCMTASVSPSTPLQVYDTRSNSLVQHYDAHSGSVNTVSFHPSGNFLLSSSNDGTLK
eukprot:594422-Prorocentrum_minimum.AAC.1